MSIKNNIVISHIESLAVGTKISVRGSPPHLGSARAPYTRLSRMQKPVGWW